MSQRATHEGFRTGGFISLWLGDQLTTEDELDTYLRGQFRFEFGFAVYPPDGPETCVVDSPQNVEDLLDGFSRSATFMEQAVEGAQLMGWDRATTAIVFYNFRYDSDQDRSTDDSPVRFIGTFRYPGFS